MSFDLLMAYTQEVGAGERGDSLLEISAIHKVNFPICKVSWVVYRKSPSLLHFIRLYPQRKAFAKKMSSSELAMAPLSKDKDEGHRDFKLTGESDMLLKDL